MTELTSLQTFIKRKRADSPFISLADGESIKMKVKEIKTMMKTGFGGTETEVIRISGEVETEFGPKVKSWDNGTLRVAEMLQNHKVKAGDTITIIRKGVGPKTKYEVLKDEKEPFETKPKKEA